MSKLPIRLNFQSFIYQLTIAFIVLKLCKVIDWSWVWVLAPMWIPVSVVLVAFAAIGVAESVSIFCETKDTKKGKEQAMSSKFAKIDACLTRLAEHIRGVNARLDSLETSNQATWLAESEERTNRLAIRLDSVEAKARSHDLAGYNATPTLKNHNARLRTSEASLTKLESTAETKTEDASMDEEDWIPCSERLPPEGVVVDTITINKKGPRYRMDMQHRQNGWCYPNSAAIVYERPTHWKPI